MPLPPNSFNFEELEKEYSIVINNIVNTFKFLSNGIIDDHDLKQEALLALYRASCKSKEKAYIIRSILNAVWTSANKFKKSYNLDNDYLDQTNSKKYFALSSLDLDGLPLRAKKIITMMFNGVSKQQILSILDIKQETFNKLLAKAKKKLIGDSVNG